MSDTQVMLRFPGKLDHLSVHDQMEVKRSAVEYEYIVTEITCKHDTMADGLVTEVQLLRKNAYEERILEEPEE